MKLTELGIKWTIYGIRFFGGKEWFELWAKEEIEEVIKIIKQ